MDAIEAIVSTLDAASRSLKTAEARTFRTEYEALLTYLHTRYPTAGVIETDDSLRLESEVDIARALRRVNAQEDRGLVERAEALRKQMQAMPVKTLSMIGVDLENVHANSIVIKDIYVNHAAEPEPIQQRTIVEYLTMMAATGNDQEIDPGSESAEATRARLANLSFYVRNPSELDDNRHDLVEAIQTSFRLDADIQRIERVVILADSGVGKTPALRYIRRSVAQASLDVIKSLNNGAVGAFVYADMDERLSLPIYINLAELQPDITIQRVILDQFNRHLAKSEMTLEMEQLPDVLNKHKCLFLLDSLDSLSASAAALQQLRQFIDEHPDEQYVITCRTVGYRTQLGSIDTLVLDDLSQDEAIAVLGRQRYRTLFASLGTLTHNRLMLRMIIDLNEMKGWNESLINKGQLIRAYALERIELNLSRSSVNDDELDLIEAALEHLAFSMYSDHVFSYSEREIMGTLKEFLERWSERRTWRDVFRMLRKVNVLKQDERRRWRLYDRSVSAYFAAAAMMRDPDHMERMLSQISDLWWQEVVEILAGLIHDPLDFFFDLMDRDVLVAANCAQYRAIDTKIANALIDALIERMAHADVATVERIAIRLGESGRPRAAEALLRALHRESTSRGVFAIATAAWAWSRKCSFDALIEAENHLRASSIHDRESYSELLLTCERIMVTSGDLRDQHEAELHKILLSSNASRLRRGLCAIGLGYSLSEEAHETLIKLLISDEDPFVAWCATDTLTRSRHPDLEQTAKNIFFEQAMDHPARARSVYLLGWIARTKQSWSFLRSEAIKDDDAVVRAYAAEALVRLDLPDARQAIEQCLDHETDPMVIDKCAKALTIVGTTASLPSLERHLFCERARTRWSVKSALHEINQRYGI